MTPTFAASLAIPPLAVLSSLGDVTEAMLALGYKPGAPAHVSAEAVAIDREVAAEASCERCGHTGLLYHSWRRGRCYRAIAGCPACSHAFEF